MTEPQKTTVQRILVVIDASPHETEALEAAARLATELSAELQGVFIEDSDLLRLAGLPFASEIDALSGVLRPLDAEALERALRRRAEGVRRAIAETAQRTSLRWSFRISRGNIVQTLLTEALEADWLVIGQESTSASSRTSKAPQGPIMVVVDECSGLGSRALNAAQRLARRGAENVIALIVDNCVASLDRTEFVVPCYVQRCSGQVQAVSQAVRQWRPQLLLVDRASQLVAATSIKSLLNQLPCPLVIVQN